MFSILPLARKLFITLVVVFMKELPAIQISLLSIKQLLFVIFLVWYKPYAIKQRNLDEIRNELLIMIYLMLTRIYTPWVTDVQVRNQASFVPLVLISLNILVSFVYIIIRSITEVKKNIILLKHKNKGKPFCQVIKAKFLMAFVRENVS